MKYDIYFIEVGFHLSYLDPKFKGKTQCIPNIGDYVDYELFYKGGCINFQDKVVDRVHYLQDDNTELRVSVTDKETLEELLDLVKIVQQKERERYCK